MSVSVPASTPAQLRTAVTQYCECNYTRLLADADAPDTYVVKWFMELNERAYVVHVRHWWQSQLNYKLVCEDRVLLWAHGTGLGWRCVSSTFASCP